MTKTPSGEHLFTVDVDWTGNLGTGTSGAREYARTHTISSEAVSIIDASAARVFHGDSERWNPEQLLLAAVSQCHMMTYFYLATQSGIVVTEYTDHATGIVRMDADGIGGQFSGIELRPCTTVSQESDLEIARSPHARVHELCFIARSISVPITYQPQITVERTG